MKRSRRTLRARVLGAGLALGASLPSGLAHADIMLNDPAKSDGWAVSTSGQVNAYGSYIFGDTINRSGLGNLTIPSDPTSTRYRLVGPQVNIQGNPTPSGAVSSPVDDKDLGTFRIRGGFASTILNFMVKKQLLQDLKLEVKLGFWAGIDNAQVAGVRQKNDVAAVDWREQFIDLSGSWGTFWGGRKLGLYNRGGHTGVGSMFPNRNAQIGYATPDVAGLQLSVALFDGAMISDQWNRTPLPRFEAEATFKKAFGGPEAYPNELNAWLNGLSQTVGRTQENPPQPAIGHPGVPADATVNVFGLGGGAWGRFSGIGLGGTGWYGKGLGTATPFGNTAVDDVGKLRTHFGYLVIGSFRLDKFEVGASYGSTNVEETEWDKDPDNTDKVSVIKQVSGIGGKVAYHLHKAVVLSVDGMNIRHEWWRGEKQVANVVSAGLLAKW
jgi:hypothetical protein